MMIWRIALLLFLLNVILVLSFPENGLTTKRRRLCGQFLSSALAVACRGQFNSRYKKFYDDLFTYGEYEDNFSDENNDNQIDFPFLGKEQNGQMIPAPVRRGIVQECCYDSCSEQHLKKYCA